MFFVQFPPENNTIMKKIKCVHLPVHVQNEEIVNRTCWLAISRHGWMILKYMYSEQLWDKQYQITNQYLDRFSRN